MISEASQGNVSTSQRLVLWRIVASHVLAAVLLGAGLAVSTPEAMASPYSLFLKVDTASVSEGGADVPGQITRRPQVRRPCSLSRAGQPVFRFDYSSQTPVTLDRGDDRAAEWKDRLLSAQYITPLGRRAELQRWTMGVETHTGDHNIGGISPDWGYSFPVSLDSLGLSVAYRLDSEWTIGAGYDSRDSDSVVTGAALADYLGLAPDAPAWPGLDLEASKYTLAISRDRPEYEWGLQYDWSRPTQNLHLRLVADDYSASMGGDAYRLEGYLARPQGRETYFLSGWDSENQTQGVLLVGLAGSAGVGFSTSDRSLILGWCKGSNLRGQQLSLDWRESRFGTDNHGYVGLLASDEVAALSADGKLSTWSLRYGRQTPLGSHLVLLSSISMHRARADGNLLAQMASEPGEELETVAEYHIAGGRLYLYTMSLGLSYGNDRHRAALVYTGGYANANGAFKAGYDSGNSGDGEDGHSYHLRAGDFMTFSFETLF